tara:strand:- start:7025 stop:8167 length:1143 start_codon:yes stop_codon:yes gene_type:complete
VPKLVALDIPGGELFVSALQRIWDEGNAAFPVDQRLPFEERRKLIERMGASKVITPDSEQDRKGHPVEDGDALVVATSGTGGSPKGVVLTHDAIAASAKMTSDSLLIDSLSDRWLCCIPVSHIGGLSVVTRALLTGTEVEVHSKFSASACEKSGRLGSTLVSLVVTAMRRIDISLFRKVLVGGSSIPMDLPPNVVATYGMTETASGVVYDGIPLEGVEIKIVDGQILIKSPSLLRCYRNGVLPFTDGEWFPTGDGGEFDKDGKLRVFGRIEHVIVSGGEMIWPASVERALSGLSWVDEAAVVGNPDEEWGEVVTAFVVPANKETPISLEQTREALSEALPRFALPRALHIVNTLPKTTSGKVAKKRLLSGPEFDNSISGD